MKKIIMITFILCILFSLKVFANDYKETKNIKIECTKHVTGDIFRLWLGDVPNNRFYITKNGNYENVWFNNSYKAKYDNDNILLVFKMTEGNSNTTNDSKVFNLIEGINEFDYELKGNIFKITITVPITQTNTPTQSSTSTITPSITPTNIITIEPTNTSIETNTQTNIIEPTPSVTPSIESNTPNITIKPTIEQTTEGILITNTPITQNKVTVNELPKTGEDNTIYYIIGLSLILLAIPLKKVIK